MSTLLIFHGKDGDFLLGSQVASLFRTDQNTFFQKYNRLWKRESSEDEMECLKRHDLTLFESLPKPILFLKSSDILAKLQQLAPVKFTLQDVHMDSKIIVSTVKETILELNDKEKKYISILNKQKEQFSKLVEERKKEREQEVTKQASRLAAREAMQLDTSEKHAQYFRAGQTAVVGSDILVPVRLDLEFEGIKFKDTFTWHLQEKSITPEMFAEILCEDFGLPSNLFLGPIARSIKEQLVDFSNYVKPSGKNLVELRIIIKLDITVGNVTLVDQFEWDMNRLNSANDPEWFAEILTAELVVKKKYRRTSIAHCIREQVYWHTKSLLVAGYSFDSPHPPIMDEEMQDAFLAPVIYPFREDEVQDLFSPFVLELTDQDIEKLEHSRERDARRKRRLNRGRRMELWALRDPPKTCRSFPKRVTSFLSQIKPQKTSFDIDVQRKRLLVAKGDLRSIIPKDASKSILPSNLIDPLWKCLHCSCSVDETPLLRRGPKGERGMLENCLEPADLDFLSQDITIDIIPLMSLDKFSLICTTVGPLYAGQKSSVPLWLALTMKKTKNCKIIPPEWFNVEKLKEWVEQEKTLPEYAPVPFDFFTTSRTLLQEASDDIPNSEILRRLVQNLKEIRQSKTVGGFSDIHSVGIEGGLFLNGLSHYEINEVRSLLTKTLEFVVNRIQ